MSLSVSEGERVACHLCKKLYKVEDICYHVDVCEEDQQRLAKQNPVSIVQPVENTLCPICNKMIEKIKIEEHVNHCLDSKPVVEPNPEKPQNEEENPFLKQQQEYLNYFAKLKLNPNLPNPHQPQPNPRPEVDLQIALEIHRKEKEELDRIKALREKDEELAKKIWQEEEEREKRRKQDEADRAKQVEWQKTVELVKKEALLESDAKMAKMLAEKEELEQKLEELERERRFKNKPVSINVDDVDLPEYWAIHPYGIDHLSVDVTEEDDDYHHVSSTFLADMPNARILRIERNQNTKLWTWYSLKKKFMEAEGNANEQFLFHGSRVNAYDTILKEGFDHRVANLQGAFGAGCYFGSNAKTSHGFVSPANMAGNHHFAHHVLVPNYKRHRKHVNQWGHNFWNEDEQKLTHKMMYCRVLLGKVGPGSQGLRRPPEIHGQKGKRYDSVGNNSMSVIFDNAQAYPEYVIHYEN